MRCNIPKWTPLSTAGPLVSVALSSNPPRRGVECRNLLYYRGSSCPRVMRATATQRGHSGMMPLFRPATRTSWREIPTNNHHHQVHSRYLSLFSGRLNKYTYGFGFRTMGRVERCACWPLHELDWLFQTWAIICVLNLSLLQRNVLEWCLWLSDWDWSSCDCKGTGKRFGCDTSSSIISAPQYFWRQTLASP